MIEHHILELQYMGFEFDKMNQEHLWLCGSSGDKGGAKSTGCGVGGSAERRLADNISNSQPK